MSNPPTIPSYAPQPQPKGGMPKWLIILLVILLLIMLGCCGGFVTCTLLVRKGVAVATQAATMAAPEIARQSGVNVDTSGNGIDLPGNFPSDVPVFTGMKAKGSVAPPGAKGGVVTFTGSAAPKDIADFYDRELTGKGWTQAQTIAQPNGFMRVYTKDKQTVEIACNGGGGETTLEITYGTSN